MGVVPPWTKAMGTTVAGDGGWWWTSTWTIHGRPPGGGSHDDNQIPRADDLHMDSHIDGTS